MYAYMYWYILVCGHVSAVFVGVRVCVSTAVVNVLFPSLYGSHEHTLYAPHW